jgi:hypothetical protein
MNLRSLQIRLAIAAFASLTTFSRADVAFSDLSATAPYFYGFQGWAVEGALQSPPGGQTIGAQFTSTLSGGITSVVLGLTLYPFGNVPSDANVNVYLEPVPSTPGLVDLNTAILLGTATTTTVFTENDGSELTDVTLIAPGLVSLTANQAYYLILQPTDPNTLAVWNGNNTNAEGNLFLSRDLGASFIPFGNNPNNTLPAFQIEVTSVPEPASLWLAALGVIGAVILRLRKTTRPT